MDVPLPCSVLLSLTTISLPLPHFLLSFQTYIAAMDFSQMSSAEQAHMTRVIERKQVRLQARHNIRGPRS